MTVDQINEFFPSVSKQTDIISDITDYENDSIGSGNRANEAWLAKRIPTLHPPPDYFQEDELELLISKETPLRYPPIYYMRKIF